MTRPRTHIDWQKVQQDLRDNGLLADAHEPWISPEGLRLDAMPQVFKAKGDRRQRGDRITNFDKARMGLTDKKVTSKNGKARGRR